MRKLPFKIPHKLWPAFAKPKRYKVLLGGRGSGKSHTTADIKSYDVAQNGFKIGCFREYQTSIEDSVLSLISSEIERIQIPGFKITKHYIDHQNGGGFRFKGLARMGESMKSYHAFMKFWIEEAQFLSQGSIDILGPTLRLEGSEVWLTLNAGSSADPVSKRFLVPYWEKILRDGYYEDDMHLIIMCNYYDNPLFPEVLEKERQKDYEILPRALYDHIWLGRFNDTVADAIIDPEWFDAAVDSHEKLGWTPIGPLVAIHDPSDLGEDPKGYVLKHGNYVIEAISRDFQDVNEGADWACSLAREANVDHFIWDCDGMGVSLRRQIHTNLSGLDPDFSEFHGAGAVERPGETYEGPGQSMKSTGRRLNKNLFINKRAQCYWRLRDRFLNTYMAVVHNKYIDPDDMISISSGCRNIELLRSEICRIPRKFNTKGMIQIMNKKEMATLKIMSPNLADCCMMAESDYTPMSKAKDLKFESLFA